MKGKKAAVLLTSAVLGISVFAGYGTQVKAENQEETQTEAKTEASKETEAENAEKETEAADSAEASADPIMDMITEGYYTYAYPVEGLGDFTYFFHFYEEQPVLGSVFYAGFAQNQINFAGTYKVEKKDFDYACFESRETAEKDGGKPVEGTAPYTITFYGFDGKEMDSCGFDGEILYQDMDVITGVGGGPVYYHHDTEGETSKYYDFYQAEAGMTYLDFIAEDPTSTLTLYHNGRYMDMVNMMVEGTWSMNEAEEGYEYVLKPDMDTDTAAVLTVSADTMTAVYTPDGGDAVTMTNKAGLEGTKKPVMTLKGQVPAGEDVMADVIGNMYEDETVTLIATAYGQELELDAGTYKMGDDGFTVTFKFDKAGEIVSALGDSGAAIQYVQKGSNLGDIDTELVISMVE